MSIMTRQHPPAGRPTGVTRTVTVAAMPLLVVVISGFLLTGCGSGDGTAPYRFSSGASTPTATPTPFPTASPTPIPTGSLTPPYFNKVAFISRRGATERDQLYVMNPDGSQVTPINPLTNFSAYNLKYPGSHYMSADGTKFLFTFDIGTGAGAESFLVNADGTNQRDITMLLDPTATSLGTAFSGKVSDVSMNANGTRLVFPYTPSTDSSGTFLANPVTSLVTMNADGSARTTLYAAPLGQKIISPIFAPDGQTLYFLQGTTAETFPFAFTGSVYRLAPGATTPTLLATSSTRSSTGSTSPVIYPQISVSADGTKIAFNNYVDGSSDEIFVINTDGTGLVRLTNNTLIDADPAFTADGTKVVFVSYRDGNAELYSVNPDGTGEARLTYEIEPDTEPATRAVVAKSAAAGNASSRKAILR